MNVGVRGSECMRAVHETFVGARTGRGGGLEPTTMLRVGV